ncbi:efflux RND transporter periplasmic adaptor subunit [Candidatus Binatia bacterium]|nr:efflux RND transporter periplasmic adaptor subunit [Candidatus Binatia bacterium]
MRALIVLLGAAGVWLVVRVLLPPPIAVDVAPVSRGPFEEVVEEDGRTRVHDRYVVSAPLSGRLERIALRAGDRVEDGAVVAIIQPTAPPLLDARTTRELTERVGAAEAALEQARAALGRAQAAREQSRIDHERERKLAADGIVAASELDRARLTFELAEKDLAAAASAVHTSEHDLESARAALARVQEGGDAPFSVTSPVTGRILRVLQESAATVSQGTPLLEIADPANLEVVVDVLTSDAVRIAPGAAVRLDRWGGETPLQARVRLVEPAGFTKLSALGVEEQRTNVVIDITSPPAEWQALGDGFRVDARIVVFHTDEALKVPASALFRDGDEWAAFVIDGGRARKRSITSPRRNASEAMIDRGVSEGETVILYPTDAIGEGVTVAPRAG